MENTAIVVPFSKEVEALNAPPGKFRDFIKVSDLRQNEFFRVVEFETKKYKEYGRKLTLGLIIDGKKKTLFMSPTFLEETRRQQAFEKCLATKDQTLWLSLVEIVEKKRKKKNMSIPKYVFEMRKRTIDDDRVDKEQAEKENVVADEIKSKKIDKKRKKKKPRSKNKGKNTKKEIISLSTDDDASTEDMDEDDDDDDDEDDDLEVDYLDDQEMSEEEEEIVVKKKMRK